MPSGRQMAMLAPYMNRSTAFAGASNSSDTRSSMTRTAPSLLASRLAVFAGIDGERFRRLVVPGDVLDLELTVDRLRETIGRGAGRVSVGDQTVLEGTLLFGFVDAVPA